MNSAKDVKNIDFDTMDESSDWEYVMLDTLVFKENKE